MSRDETVSKIISKQPKKKKSPNILSPVPYPTVCTGLWTTGSYMPHSHFQKHSHLNRATYTAHFSQTLGLSHGKDPATIFLGLLKTRSKGVLREVRTHTAVRLPESSRVSGRPMLERTEHTYLDQTSLQGTHPPSLAVMGTQKTSYWTLMCWVRHSIGTGCQSHKVE